MPVAQAHNVAHHAPHRRGAGVGQPRVEPSGGLPPLAQEPAGDEAGAQTKQFELNNGECGRTAASTHWPGSCREGS